MMYLVALALLGGLIAFVLLFLKERELRTARESEASKLKERFGGILDAEDEQRKVVKQFAKERDRLLEQQKGEMEKLEAEKQSIIKYTKDAAAEINLLDSKITALRIEFKALDEESNLIAFGFYKPRYAFADSERFQNKLNEILEKQKALLKDKRAAVCDTEWSAAGSKSEGKKLVNDTLKLMLRAFIGECDAAISKVKFNNVQVMETRINKAFESINGFGESLQCHIVREFLNLKLEELYLTHEFEEKLQAEKEEQRRIKEQIREEEIAQREIERAKKDAEDEERRYQNALLRAKEEAEKAVGAKHEALAQQVAELEKCLEEAQQNKARAISRAQMTRSGHVYIISNIGSFGEHVYKIGMTRRLEPLDRVRELGDASVPFPFDVHAIIYSEDAPSLENALHTRFQDHRVNKVNDKKEFFKVDLNEIARIVREHCGEIMITLAAEAQEYRKTQALFSEKAKSTAAD